MTGYTVVFHADTAIDYNEVTTMKTINGTKNNYQA